MTTPTHPRPGTEPAGRVTDPRDGRPYLMSTRDTARALGVSERTIYAMSERGELRRVRLGGRVLYDPADLRDLIDRAKEGGGV